MAGSQTAMAAATDELGVAQRGALGILTLRRPKALNALTPGMVRAMATALDAWEGDGSIATVLLEGEGERAFCAGGDVRAIAQSLKAGDVETPMGFWREEYELIARLNEYSKPVVSLIDGIVMGGGVGVSCHNRHVVGTERMSFAMPETAIGFFPDVGVAHSLPRLPREFGTYLAMTGARIGAGTARRMGIATRLLPSVEVAAFTSRLEADGVDSALDGFEEPSVPEPEDQPVREDVIARTFRFDEAPAILAALEEERGEGEAFARETAATMRSRAPSSVVLALAQMRAGRGLDLRGALALDLRIVRRVAGEPDFSEGVRAVLIDKDHAPRWAHGSVADVPAEFVAAHFAPLDDRPELFAGRAA